MIEKDLPYTLQTVKREFLQPYQSTALNPNPNQRFILILTPVILIYQYFYIHNHQPHPE
jgi:hypothetical protein